LPRRLRLRSSYGGQESCAKNSTPRSPFLDDSGPVIRPQTDRSRMTRARPQSVGQLRVVLAPDRYSSVPRVISSGAPHSRRMPVSWCVAARRMLASYPPPAETRCLFFRKRFFTSNLLRRG
jgi:hypothetical protein